MTFSKTAAAPALAPRSPQEFIAHASALAWAGRDRELLAFADRYGEQFFGHFTAAELNRLEGLFEGAQAIVDLEEWEARADARMPPSAGTDRRAAGPPVRATVGGPADNRMRDRETGSP